MPSGLIQRYCWPVVRGCLSHPGWAEACDDGGARRGSRVTLRDNSATQSHDGLLARLRGDNLPTVVVVADSPSQASSLDSPPIGRGCVRGAGHQSSSLAPPFPAFAALAGGLVVGAAVDGRTELIRTGAGGLSLAAVVVAVFAGGSAGSISYWLLSAAKSGEPDFPALSCAACSCFGGTVVHGPRCPLLDLHWVSSCAACAVAPEQRFCSRHPAHDPALPVAPRRLRRKRSPSAQNDFGRPTRF